MTMQASTPQPGAAKRLTGYHVLAIFVAFFGVVIAVNVLMARFAVSTFAGTVVDNSYVASQNFNHWIAQSQQQRALGWTVTTGQNDAGQLTVVATDAAGAPLAGAHVTAHARHPLGVLADRDIAFTQSAPGTFLSAQPLPQGRWQIITVVTAADGKMLRQASMIE